MLITRVFAISVFGLALPTGALTQTASRGRSRILNQSIRTGSQVTSPTGHVRRALHSMGGVLALAALAAVRGT